MSGIVRIIVGALGGFAASASKILALDVERLGKFVENGQLHQFGELSVAIFVFTPLLMFLGGVVAWASGEEQRMKLLAIGCAAPALLAPWTVGNVKPNPHVVDLSPSFFISSAYAEDSATSSTETTFFKGLKALFGVEQIRDKRYWVIVDSSTNEKKAEQFANAINEVDPTLEAFVGKREPGNSFYPVIVGGQDAYLPFDEAMNLREKALGTSIIPESSYLSDFANR